MSNVIPFVIRPVPIEPVDDLNFEPENGCQVCRRVVASCYRQFTMYKRAAFYAETMLGRVPPSQREPILADIFRQYRLAHELYDVLQQLGAGDLMDAESVYCICPACRPAGWGGAS